MLGLLLAYSAVRPPVQAVSSLGLLSWFVVGGEYPMASWLVYSVIGLGVGLYLKGLKLDFNRAAALGLAVAWVSLIVSFVGFSLDATWNSTMFLLFVVGSHVAVSSVMSFLGSRGGMNFIPGFLAVYGRHSLLLYVVHQFLFITVPRLAGFANTLGAAEAVFIFVGFLGLAWLALKRLES